MRRLAAVGNLVNDKLPPIGRVVGGVLGLAGLVGDAVRGSGVAGWPLTALSTGLLVLVMFGAISSAVAADMRAKKLSNNARLMPDNFPTTLHDLHHCLRFCAHAVRYLNGAGARAEVDQALRAAATLFSDLTQQTCRACVKLLYYNGPVTAAALDWNDPQTIDQMRVETLVRNGDPPHSGKDDPIRITDSTAFETLYHHRGTRRWHVVHDIEQAYCDGTYKNITRPANDLDPDYNSAIVWPIQLDPRRFAHGVNEHIHIFGYLCVDTLATDVFTVAHGWIGSSVADAFFTALYVQGVQPPAHPVGSGAQATP